MSEDRRLNILQNEATLLWYSFRMLVGRNLIAVGIISIVALGAVFSYTVSLRDTKWSVLVAQLEMFAPLLGIVVFSDLIAGDVEAKRATLLMSSRYGIVPVVIRKLVHGLIITSATYLINLLILRVFYTSFSIVPAFLIVVPGALYFGMIGLLAATFTSRALAGYAAGTAALILSMVVPETMPLVPTAFALRGQLATATLFAENNWLLAKAVFVVLAFVMAALVIVIAGRRSLRFHAVIAAGLLLACCYSVTHIIWSREVQPDIYFTTSGKQLDVIQDDSELIVRAAAVRVWGRGRNKTNEEALLTDTLYKSEKGRWVEQRKVEYDPSREYDLVHLDIDADVVPSRAAIDAEARAEIKVLAESLHKIYIRIGWELQITRVEVDGARRMFSRYGDLVEIPLAEPVEKDKTIRLDIAYAGALRLPSARQRLESNDKDTLFVNSRWYPFVKSWYHAGPWETCTYDMRITVPSGWHVGAAELESTKGAGRTWHFGTDTPCDRVGLLITRLDKQHAQVGDITVTVFGQSISNRYMRQIAERACDALRYYETAFGKYPHRNLAIVEYDHMGAGGTAVPSIVLMNTKRCRPEHKSDMLNMYVPHEVAHQWHSSALPAWIAEASAVYSNYLYLAQRPDGQDYLTEFLKGLNEFLESNKDYPAPLVNSTGIIAYVRGGYLLVMLTSANKQRTVDSLRAFITDQLSQQLVDKDATVKSFIEAMNKAAGSDLTQFVSDWVHTVDKFDPAVNGFVQSKTGDRFHIKTSLINYEQIRFPVPLRISFEDGTHYDATWDNTEEKKTLEWTFDKPAVSITLDPENILLDWNRFNNVRRASAFAPSETAQPTPALPAKKQTAGWTTYTIADGLTGNNVRGLDIGPDGMLFAGLSLYTKKPGTVVNRFDGEWTQPDTTSDPSGSVYAVAVERDGTIWTGGSARLRRIDETGTTVFTLSQLRHYRSLGIGKARFEPNPQANTRIPGYVVYDLITDEQGNIWVATDNGISIIDGTGQLLHHFDTDDGLPGNEVLCMTADSSGTLWIGTDKGPASYRDDRWTAYPECPAGIILAVTTDPRGNIYFGTYRHGVIIYDGTNYRRYDNLNSRLPHNMVTALAYDGQNGLWAGTCLGLLHIQGDSQQVYNKDNSVLLSNRISDVLADGLNIWIATDVGIAKYKL